MNGLLKSDTLFDPKMETALIRREPVETRVSENQNQGHSHVSEWSDLGYPPPKGSWPPTLSTMRLWKGGHPAEPDSASPAINHLQGATTP